MIKVRLGQFTAELYGSGMVWIEELRLLCAADIHFEKGSYFHQFGALLPPYDSQETLAKLERAIAHFNPEIFVALGDSFHDAKAVNRMEILTKAQLNTLIGSVARWIWVTGNHDPVIDMEIAGARVEQIQFGDVWFRHEHTDNTVPEISGHYHPKTTVKLRGTRITAPCFVQRGPTFILPSFGSYTGGLDINSHAFLDVMPAEGRIVYMAHREQVYNLAPYPCV